MNDSRVPLIRRIGVRGVVGIACLLSFACQSDPSARKREYLESGNRYLADGKYPHAIIEYRNAIDIDPTFGEARKRLAEAYARTGDAPQALEQYVRAADFIPTDVQLQLTAGAYLLAARKPGDALARADYALKQQPDSIQALLLRGNALAGLSSFDEALKAIEEAIRLDPERGTSFTQLGLVEFARGRTSEAEAAFIKAVELAPKSVETYFALGNFYWSVGNAGETEKAFQGALNVDAKNGMANRAMAAFSIATGKYRAAEPYLIRLAESGDPNAVFALTDYYIASGRAKEAVARLEADGGAMKDVPNVGQRLARAYAAAGDTTRAKTLVEQVLAGNPSAVDAQLLRSQLLFDAGNRDEAYAAVHTAASSSPESAEAQFALARVYAARGDRTAAEAAYRDVLRINPRAAAAQVAIARLQLSSGNREASLKTAEEVTRTQPQNLDARLQLARSLMASGDVRRAERELTALRSAYPNVSAVHIQAGMLALLKNDIAGARASFNRAESLDSRSLELLAAWLALEFKTNDVPGAKARVEKRLNEGATPGLLILAARTYLSAKDQLAAESALRQAIELDASLLPPYEMLGQLYIAQKKLGEARTEFEALAKRQSKPVSALTMSGMILMAQGQTEPAKKRFEEVLAIDPRAAIAANNLAWMHAESGENLDTALKLAQIATAQVPDQPELMDTLGWVYYKKNVPKLASALFEGCVKKAPGIAAYHYHLGLAYLQSGDIERGRAALHQALALSPNQPLAVDIRRALAESSPANPKS